MTITPVSGFMTKDQTFFQKREEAEYYEALQQLEQSVSKGLYDPKTDADNIINFIKTNVDTVFTFCFKFRALQAEQVESKPHEPRASTGKSKKPSNSPIAVEKETPSPTPSG